MIGDKQLAGKVALITGGRRGIGRAIAMRYAAEGAAVIIGANFPDDEGLEETVAEIREQGVRCEALACDLSDASARSKLIERANTLLGPVDIIVNNAAVNNYQDPATMALDYRHFMFDVNFHAPIDLIQQALPHMQKTGWGRIVNIASDTITQAPLPYPGSELHVNGVAVYGASKLALLRYSEGLAAQLRYSGITVNTFYPHKVCVTEMNSEAALEALRVHPDWAESVEMMAEAAQLLVTRGVTGIGASSREILQLFQSDLHDCLGQIAIGNAATLANLD
jgi:NAD(P)-dependent dehydrogenase (short-subunit alcohol dehydrogenase family)